jgi:hypothetical protein
LLAQPVCPSITTVGPENGAASLDEYPLPVDAGRSSTSKLRNVSR